jgi:Domain of unknown function (DUF5664)
MTSPATIQPGHTRPLEPGKDYISFSQVQAAKSELQQLQEGRKDDTGKITFDLLPDDALAAIQKILDFGAKKYAPRNWEKGMNWLRVWNACMRHLWAWVRCEKEDPESKLSHLWHAGCCILFLISFEIRKIGTDDRNPGG